MNRRTRSQASLRSANNRAPRSPLVAAYYDEARIIYQARVARQREERAARYAARVARAEARAQAAVRPPPPVSPPPQAPEPTPSPPIRRPLATICGNGTSSPLRPPRPAWPIPAGAENAPPPTSTNTRSLHRNRSSTDRVVGPYTLFRLR